MKLARTALCLAITACAFLAFAQANVTGVWKGKVSVNTSKLPKGESKETKQMLDQMMKMLEKMTMTLDMKANKTFTIRVTNVPGGQGTQTAGGTWKVTGNKVALTTTTENGKPAKKKDTQTLTLAANGKKMTMEIPQSQGAASVTFSR